MELKERGLEVFEARKEKMKKNQMKKKEAEEKYKEKVQHYAKCILDVFDASNPEQDSDILVWRIRILHLASEKIQCEIDFTPNDAEEKRFFKLKDLKQWEYHDKVKKVMCSMQTIEAFECTPTIVKDIGVFLKENLDEDKYDIVCLGLDSLIISMKEPAIF